MADPTHPPSHCYINTENIRAGDVILEEEAWVWSFLNLGSAKLACNYCFKLSDKLKTCSACKSAFYCDATCQQKDWRLRHKYKECQNLRLIRRKAQEKPGAIMQNFEQIHFNVMVPRLLLSAASARLFRAGGRDENGKPATPLWNTFIQTPYKSDLVDLNLQPEHFAYAVCRSITHEDSPEFIIQNRVLPSLVLLANHEPWMKALRNVPYMMGMLQPSQFLALGACLEMSKYPNTCDRPNAITINDGKLVRMIALEDIQNLEQVRLSRFPVWLNEHRYQRRAVHLYRYFGYGCFCSRCSTGDTAAETTLFALRCPKWAKYYPLTINREACNGIVKGLRRTDMSSSGIRTMTGETEPDLDEPLSFNAADMLAPPHERAVCMLCNAKYDAATMKSKILPLLKGMDMLRVNLGCGFTSRDDDFRAKVLEAEKYVYPTNYVFLAAKRILLRRIMQSIQMDVPILRADVALWLRNYVREVLARVEAVGCQQMDMFGLQDIVGVYGYCVVVALRSSKGEGGGGLPVDADTCELLLNTAMCATEKLKLLLQIRDE